MTQDTPDGGMDRRDFLKLGGGAIAAATLGQRVVAAGRNPTRTALSLDSLSVGPGWESLNPGFWQVSDGAVRRRFGNYGERARNTGFPFHYESHGRNGGTMPVEYDPSLPPGTL